MKSILNKLESSLDSTDFLKGLIKKGFEIHPDSKHLHKPTLKERKVTEDEIINVFDLIDEHPEIAYIQVIGKKGVQTNECFFVRKP